MATFAEKEFFGTAIGGVIPPGWIDARYVFLYTFLPPNVAAVCLFTTCF